LDDIALEGFLDPCEVLIKLGIKNFFLLFFALNILVRFFILHPIRKVKYSAENCFNMSKPSDLGSLKIGSYILLPHTDQPSGEPCRIVEYDTSKPGKHGSAKARIVAEGVFDGQKRPHVGPVSMQIHVPLINKKVGQIISMTGDIVQVMDSESFETIDITLVDDEVKEKLENGQNVEYWVVMDKTKIMRIKG
jgi:translation initiation factor 5A